VKASLIILLVTVGNLLYAQTSYTVETVPNEKLRTNSYVSNPDGILTDATAAEINSILTALEDTATAQVAVVALNSIGDQDVFTFAQELFDLWKIGDREKDNGLLILLVKDQRKVWFNTGNGIEGILPDATCKQIQRESMVPFFKEGNYDQGMLEGVKSAANILSHPDDASLNQSNSEGTSVPDLNLIDFGVLVSFIWIIVAVITFIVKIVRKSFAKKDASPDIRYGAFGWLMLFILLPVLVITLLSFTDNFAVFFAGLYSYFTLGMLRRRSRMDNEAGKWLAKKEYQAVYNFYREKQGLFSAMRFLLPLPFAFLYGSYKRKMAEIRNHPRDCNECGKPLTKLDEQRDDEFLSKGQRLEESLKSVDYDVWKCSGCNAAEKLSYINENSKYSGCPKCQFYAYYEVSDRVIRAATTSSSGEGEEKHACKHCGHQNVRRYTIARIEESSSSSGGSSSSSGGSWGGGSSSGGGAGSSW
jgi:uncharacterized protein